MAGGDTGGQPRRDPAEQRFLAKLRLISIGVVLSLVFLMAIADTLGRLLIAPDFHVGDVIFTALLGALVTMLGFESIARVAGNR